MSDILKIEYVLTLTLIALLLPPTPCYCQACRHRPQGCSHAAALVAGAPSAAAALMLRCPLCLLFALPPPLRCRHCAAAAAATQPPQKCCRPHAAITAKLPLPPPRCHCCHCGRAAAKLPPPSPSYLPPPSCCYRHHAAVLPPMPPSCPPQPSCSLPPPRCRTAAAAPKLPAATKLSSAARLPPSCRVWRFWWCGCVLCVDVWYQQFFCWWVMVLTTHSHNRWKWTRLLKIWFPAPTLQKETKNAVWHLQGKIRIVVIFWHKKCYHVWHTHLQKMLRGYNLRDFFFVMVKNQTKDEACV